MSERSKNLAHYIRRAKGHQPEIMQANHDEVLDKGLSLLKEGLAREFHNQISEANHEPGCMDSLGSRFTDKESRVFRIGQEAHGLTVDFNPAERTAEIRGTEPIKCYYFIRVRLAKDETKWCYAGGENKEELAPITGKLDTVVEKALFALFGVEA
jgi:hypothetical protein